MARLLQAARKDIVTHEVWGGWDTTAEVCIGFHSYQPRARIWGYNGQRHFKHRVSDMILKNIRVLIKAWQFTIRAGPWAFLISQMEHQRSKLLVCYVSSERYYPLNYSWMASPHLICLLEFSQKYDHGSIMITIALDPFPRRRNIQYDIMISTEPNICRYET